MLIGGASEFSRPPAFSLRDLTSALSQSRVEVRVGKFDQFSRAAEQAIGTPLAFVIACATILMWILSGPLFSWGATWQLIINTGTTILTWLMLFLLQGAQNRQAEATQLKLSELLRAVEGARTELANAEDFDKVHLDALRDELRDTARRQQP